MSVGTVEPSATRNVPWHEDFYFGPPSEPVDVPAFLSEAAAAHSAVRALNASPEEGREEEAERGGFPRDCDVSDLRAELDDLLAIPKISGSLRRGENVAILASPTGDEQATEVRAQGGSGSISAETSGQKTNHDSAILRVKEALEQRPLRISRLAKHAELFIRKSRLSDQNSLINVLSEGAAGNVSSSSSGFPPAPVAVLSISVYSVQPAWPRALRLSSKHEFLSQHTLADLVRRIRCHAGDLVSVEARPRRVDILESAFVGMENNVYGPDGQDATDLLTYLASSVSQAPHLAKEGQNLEEARFDGLQVRMRYPYWIVHKRTCEHIWVIDSIHLHDPSEPPTLSYPLITFLPRSLSPNCRLCQSLPADIAVSGDIRLGESPSLICKTCWDLLGWPRGGIEIQAYWLPGNERSAS